MSDEDQIAEFIAKRGVTKLPAQPAFVLGEISPGWRRSAERVAEMASRTKSRRAEPKRLRERWGR